MHLAEATEDDVETLAAYWYHLATEMEPYSDLNEVAHDGSEQAESGFRSIPDDDESTPYLLVADGSEVGLLLLREGDQPSRTHDSYVRLVDLFVAEEHRDQGFGSEAIDRVRSIARECGADYVKVSCEWHNDGARRLYEDNGFTEKQATYVQRVQSSGD
jgi:ribosomal protein S18 acetylase RimI-like enzyme